MEGKGLRLPYSKLLPRCMLEGQYRTKRRNTVEDLASWPSVESHTRNIVRVRSATDRSQLRRAGR